MSTPKRFTTSDAVSIAYSDQGAGPVVLLLHGFGCNRSHWAFQQAPLEQAGYRVLAMDFRFHGDSDSPDFGQRISRLAMDVSDLIEHEQLSDVTMVGHSMGVSVGLAYLSLVGADGLSKFVAIDQSPRIINDPTWNWGVRGVSWPTMRAQLDGEVGWGDPGREPVPSASVLEMLDAAGGIVDFQASPLAALKLDHFVSDWSDVVPELSVPTWVVTGAHSPSFPLEGMQWFASTAPYGRLTVYADSGHCPHWNEHSAFNRDLIEFLGS